MIVSREGLGFDEVLLDCVNNVLMDILGEVGASFVYRRLRCRYNIEREAIPGKIEDFSRGLVDLLGSGGEAILHLIVDYIADELHMTPPKGRRLGFLEKLRTLSEAWERRVINLV